MELKQPIFLLASERSGSNLIRVIFGSHPDVSAPPPIHLLDTFIPLLPAYNNLKEDHNFKALCEDVVKEIETHIGIWSAEFDPQEIYEQVKNRSFAGIYDFIYKKEVEANKSKRVFIKDNHSFDYFYYLIKAFPNAKFVYLVRDGRDFAVSYFSIPAMFESLPTIAKMWSEQQRTCLSLVTRMKDEGKIFPLHYEDLISEPEYYIKQMCEFVNLEFSPEMLNFHKRKKNIKDSKSAKAWRKLAEPVDKKNYGKYKNKLSDRQVKTFESHAYRELIQCGYPLENDVEKLIKENKRKGVVKKIYQVTKSMLKGTFINPEELRKRKKHFETKNNTIFKKEINAKPVIKIPKVYK